jgi:hypothetical protein
MLSIQLVFYGSNGSNVYNVVDILGQCTNVKTFILNTWKERASDAAWAESFRDAIGRCLDVEDDEVWTKLEALVMDIPSLLVIPSMRMGVRGAVVTNGPFRRWAIDVMQQVLGFKVFDQRHEDDDAAEPSDGGIAPLKAIIAPRIPALL